MDFKYTQEKLLNKLAKERNQNQATQKNKERTLKNINLIKLYY